MTSMLSVWLIPGQSLPEALKLVQAASVQTGIFLEEIYTESCFDVVMIPCTLEIVLYKETFPK